ncbi:ribonuclease P protein component [Eikenella sp. S3360]|uniref:Ribonuclease P protein component n=1 Tax=Eikenella glucosivorans TaxID=2766967 RepID=A0ABS0N7U5_9NEIS|nr:ribonuclease P protein component [Eikenella glucosivorans]
MDYCFGKPYRLLKTDDFSSVFALRRMKSQPALQLWSKPNGLGHPRLGLVVPKKTARRANRRNYMKRALREWFRLNRYRLTDCDLIIRARRPFDSSELPQVWAQLERMVPRKTC